MSISGLDLHPLIYKFRDFYNDFHVPTLLNNEVYIPSVSEFNDPLDSKTPFRYKEEELTDENIYKKCLQIARSHYPNRKEQEYQQMAYDNHRKGLLFDEDHLAKFDQDNYDQVCRDFGVFCTTPEYDNFLMWSYYSNSHTGFCIGYNTEVLVFSEIFGMGSNVDYRPDFPKVPLFPSEHDHHFFGLFYTKWDIWSHEKEYRFLHIYKTGKVQKIPENSVEEILLGCKFPENKKGQFIEQINRSLPNTRVYQMELIPGEFGLVKSLVFDPKLMLNF